MQSRILKFPPFFLESHGAILNQLENNKILYYGSSDNKPRFYQPSVANSYDSEPNTSEADARRLRRSIRILNVKQGAQPKAV